MLTFVGLFCVPVLVDILFVTLRLARLPPTWVFPWLPLLISLAVTCFVLLVTYFMLSFPKACLGWVSVPKNTFQ